MWPEYSDDILPELIMAIDQSSQLSHSTGFSVQHTSLTYPHLRSPAFAHGAGLKNSFQVGAKDGHASYDPFYSP